MIRPFSQPPSLLVWLSSSAAAASGKCPLFLWWIYGNPKWKSQVSEAEFFFMYNQITNWTVPKLKLCDKNIAYANSNSFLVAVTWRNIKNGLVNNFMWTAGVSVDNILVQIKFLCFSVVCVYSYNQKLFFWGDCMIGCWNLYWLKYFL